MKCSAIFILIGLPLLSWAQEQPYNGFAAFFYMGYTYSDNADLGVFLPDENAPELNSNNLNIGGEVYLQLKRFRVGGSFDRSNAAERETDSMKLSTGISTGFFKFGYTVVDKPRTKVYPLVGIGAGTTRLEMVEKGDVPITQINTQLGREIEIRQSNFMLDFSLGTDFVLSQLKDGDTDQVGGWLLGFRAGFSYAFDRDGWEFSGGDITGGPKYGPNLVYFKVTIGGGGFMRAQPKS